MVNGRHFLVPSLYLVSSLVFCWWSQITVFSRISLCPGVGYLMGVLNQASNDVLGRNLGEPHPMPPISVQHQEWPSAASSLLGWRIAPQNVFLLEASGSPQEVTLSKQLSWLVYWEEFFYFLSSSVWFFRCWVRTRESCTGVTPSHQRVLSVVLPCYLFHFLFGSLLPPLVLPKLPNSVSSFHFFFLTYSSSHSHMYLCVHLFTGRWFSVLFQALFLLFQAIEVTSSSF